MQHERNSLKKFSSLFKNYKKLHANKKISIRQQNVIFYMQ